MIKRFQFLSWLWVMTLLISTACNSSLRPTDLTPTKSQRSESNPTTTQALTPASETESEPIIDVQPKDALADEIVKIRVLGLTPSQSVTLTASLQDDLDQQWESNATFLSDQNGTVDLTVQAPISGTYQIADPMGLFWSMQPNVPGKTYPIFANFKTDSILVTLTAEIDNRQIVTTSFNRVRLQEGIERVSVTEKGLVGDFFSPGGEGPYPTLLILGGSSGSADIRKAAALASHGYATLALDYFGNPPLPQELSEIPLEYFETAIEWLKSQTVVDNGRIGVIGTSRGGELALLLAATFPDLKIVIGFSPSGVVIGNLTSTAIGEKSAWTYQGNPIPFALRGDSESLLAAIIPVEKISGPILLISGKNDKLWASSWLSEIAIARLEEHNHPYPYEHLSYRDAGHLIGLPYWPTTMSQVIDPVTGEILEFGGTARGNALASADAWAHVLKFLESNLKNAPS